MTVLIPHVLPPESASDPEGEGAGFSRHGWGRPGTGTTGDGGADGAGIPAPWAVSVPRRSRDCAADGLSCVVDGAGQVFCRRPGACTTSECDGNTLVSCVNGAMTELDCGDGVCLYTEELGGAAVCAGEGEPCEGRVFACEGDVAVTCRFGRIHREPCGPGMCSTSDGAFCRSDPSCVSPRCDGTVIVACADGEPQRFDCAEWGFAACVEVEDGGVRCR